MLLVGNDREQFSLSSAFSGLFPIRGAPERRSSRIRAFTMSNMFKCLVDCADLDLVNDCTAADAAERRYPQPGQRTAGVARQQQASSGTREPAKRGEEEVEGGDEDLLEEEEEDEDLAYDEGDINSVDVSEHLF